MEPAARRHYLREQLGRAREALDRGAPDEALTAIDQALQIDPDYLAAQALRERILRQPATPTEAAPAVFQSAAVDTPAQAPGAGAAALSAGVLRFEERIRARRIAKRAEAARAAFAGGQMRHARAAIDEIAAIDPEHPEHGLLLTELETHASRVRRRPRFALALAAAAACVAAILVVRSADRPRISAPSPAAPQSSPAAGFADPVVAATAPTAPPAAGADSQAVVVESTPLLQPTATPSVATPTASPTIPVPTAGPPMPSPSRLPVTPDTSRTDPPASVDAEPAAADRQDPGPPVAPIEPTDPGQLPGALTAPPQDARTRPLERPTDAISAARPVVIAPVTPRVRDEDLVLRTLQQYRRAYDTLDARAAQAVWPDVDGVALQRAFNGLVSQRLTFQSCQLHVNGASATAACLGTARYTPRVGSGEARNEPRDWRFTLRKTANGEWQIESARVAR